MQPRQSHRCPWDRRAAITSLPDCRKCKSRTTRSSCPETMRELLSRSACWRGSAAQLPPPCLPVENPYCSFFAERLSICCNRVKQRFHKCQRLSLFKLRKLSRKSLEDVSFELASQSLAVQTANLNTKDRQ